jgi:transcriptional regulator with XRE-family HTH domain
MPQVTIAQQLALFKSIATMVKDAREKSGMTQTELADRLDTTQSAISRLESDTNMALSVRILQMAAVEMGHELIITLMPTKGITSAAAVVEKLSEQVDRKIIDLANDRGHLERVEYAADPVEALVSERATPFPEAKTIVVTNPDLPL